MDRLTVEQYTVQELCDYLLDEERLDDSTVDVVRTNKIKGSSFLRLRADHLRELFPVVGERLDLAAVVERYKVEPETPTSQTVSSQLLNLIC